jgi:hypothetical protein
MVANEPIKKHRERAITGDRHKFEQVGLGLGPGSGGGRRFNRRRAMVVALVRRDNRRRKSKAEQNKQSPKNWTHRIINPSMT